MAKALHVLISAGEASGDLHAAAIIKALHQQCSAMDMTVSGIAGPAMRSEGCHAIERMESLNVMGLADVIKAYPRIRTIANDVCDWAEKNQPDIVILVDFGGFHMRLGERFRKLGIPVLYYIAPKLWAWGSWRIKRLRRAQDRLATILPFEKKYFSEKGINATYVGNPSAFSCRNGWTQQQLKEKLGLDNKQPLLALLPGSRSGELKRHVELLAAVYAEMLTHIPDLKVVVPRAPGVTDQQLQPLIDMNVQLIDRLHADYALRADVAVAVSGTATLELALWNVPTVLVYRADPVAMFIVRRLAGAKSAGLANVLLDGEHAMPELIQEKATVEHIMQELLPLFQDKSKADAQKKRFAELKELLGSENPAERVASMALEMAQDSNR